MATKSLKPKAKVVASTLGAAVAAIVLWGLESANVDVSTFPEAALAIVLTFVFGWVTPES